MFDRRIEPRRHGGGVEPEVGKPHDLALTHGNAACDLRQIFAGADAHQEFLGLAEIARRRQPVRVRLKLTQRLDIGREPGEAMGSALLAVEHARHGAALDRHPRGHRAPRIGKQGVNRLDRLAQCADQFMAGGRAGGFGRFGKRHNTDSDSPLRRPRLAFKAYACSAQKPIVLFPLVCDRSPEQSTNIEPEDLNEPRSLPARQDHPGIRKRSSQRVGHRPRLRLGPVFSQPTPAEPREHPTDELEDEKLQILGWKAPKAALQAIKKAAKSFAKGSRDAKA